MPAPRTPLSAAQMIADALQRIGRLESRTSFDDFRRKLFQVQQGTASGQRGDLVLNATDGGYEVPADTVWHTAETFYRGGGADGAEAFWLMLMTNHTSFYLPFQTRLWHRASGTVLDAVDSTRYLGHGGGYRTGAIHLLQFKGSTLLSGASLVNRCVEWQTYAPVGSPAVNRVWLLNAGWSQWDG